MRCERARSEKIVSGYCAATGGTSELRSRPLRMAGTAARVESCTVIALRNQVDCVLKAAKFGYLRRSMAPEGSIRELVGSSSKTANTTGVVLAPVAEKS